MEPITESEAQSTFARSSLGRVLACPRCRGQLEADSSEVLLCSVCGTRYPIVDGVPRLNLALAEHRLENVAKTFGFEWNAHHEGAFEKQTLFGRSREEDWEMVEKAMKISAEDVRGATVLDAGCGSGRFCQLFAEHGAAAVIGIDMNNAVDAAAYHCRAYPNVHIVQGNIFELPLKSDAFDLVWCNGVIHHTPDAKRAHEALAKRVKPGGVLYVWVYADRFNPFRSVKSGLNRLRVYRWPPPALAALSAAMAYVSLVLLALYRGMRSLPGLRPRTTWGKRTVRPRTIDELKLTWFDALSPEFDTRHSEAEVIGWFRDQGFSHIEALDEPKVGVRGAAPSSP